MKVLVIGAAGKTGKAVVEQAVAAGQSAPIPIEWLDNQQAEE